MIPNLYQVKESEKKKMLKELKEMYNDVEMLNILLDTAREEILTIKDLMLNDLAKLLYERYLFFARKENCLDPFNTAKECTNYEIKLIATKSISEIYEELKLYQSLPKLTK